ncbi:TetR/AcrR family transcriptional regulator [Spongiactinospora rosea]|uniref:TetR/AcrR family transcriptional regulator n=1 Tax=Spongiactinospora rosea TaxID=2248750 RepID=UPI0013142FE5|nr:TetR/AcrR family transcriptional regulator [Spongiactinospora rosea]
MPDDTRSRLIDSALTLLRSEGLEAVTLRAVGDLTGLSRTAPYRHFADKNALLAALAAQIISDLTAYVSEAVLREQGSQARLHAFYTGYVDYAVTHKEEYRLVFAPEFLAGTHAELEAAIDAVMTTFGVQPPAADRSASMAALLALLCTAHGLAELATTGHIAHRGVATAAVIDTLVTGHPLTHTNANANANDQAVS